MKNFDLVLISLPQLAKGALMTLQVFISSFAVSSIFGTMFGILTCSRLKIPFLSNCIEAIAFIFRGVPFFIQLLIVYFVLPDLLGFNLEPFAASTIALGICSTGYVAQIIRAGINSIPLSQWETASALGYNTFQSLRYVVFPQAFSCILPPLSNELDALLKSTAVISSIGMLELTRIGMNIVSREMEPVPIYLTVAVFYVLMSVFLNFLMRGLERRFFYVKS